MPLFRFSRKPRLKLDATHISVPFTIPPGATGAKITQWYTIGRKGIEVQHVHGAEAQMTKQTFRARHPSWWSVWRGEPVVIVKPAGEWPKRTGHAPAEVGRFFEGTLPGHTGKSQYHDNNTITITFTPTAQTQQKA